MASRLFHAIVFVGGTLGAGCRTELLTLDAGEDLAAETSDSATPEDFAFPLDEAAPLDMALPLGDGSCECPVKCPNPDMRSCGGRCSNGCHCFPCFF